MTAKALTGDPGKSFRKFKTRVNVEAVGHSAQLQALNQLMLSRQVTYINYLSSTLLTVIQITLVVMEDGIKMKMHCISLVRTERFSHKITIIPQELLGSKEHVLKKVNPEPLSKQQVAAKQDMVTQILSGLCVNNQLLLVLRLILTFTIIRVAFTLVLTVLKK
jgi:hypothetical protein